MFLYKGFKVLIDAEGWLISDLSTDLEKALKSSNGAWSFVPKEPVSEAAPAVKPQRNRSKTKEPIVKQEELIVEEPVVMLQDKEEV